MRALCGYMTYSTCTCTCICTPSYVVVLHPVCNNNKLNVFPTSIVSGISVNYIRKPLNPFWSFTAGTGAYVYNNLASTDFELHPAEQTELITRILLYAGVVIQSPEIIQVAAAQIQQEEMNQKS